MTNKLFNRKLYIDSLRQLRTVGIIFAISSVCISLIYPIIMFFDKINSSETYLPVPAPHIGLAAPSLYIIMFLGGIIFVMSAFSFLNKRSASDFYHSLPNTRSCTFLSLTAAILTWLYSIIIGTVLMVWFAFTVLGLSFNALHIPYLILMFIVGTTLVVTCALVAVTITGTNISTFSVTMIVLFVPRIILSVFTVVLFLTTQLVPANSLNMLINQSINIPYGFSLGLFLNSNLAGGDPIIQMFSSVSSYIYTIILAISYFVLALVLFNKRKSEVAEKSAPSKFLQHLYRLGVTLPFLLVISMFIGYDDGGMGVFRIYGSTLIIMVILAFAINCVYELVTTKAFKNVLKSIPVFVLSVGFVFGLGFVAKNISTSIASRTVDTENVEYVKVVKTRDRYSSFVNEYISSQIANIKITDKEILTSLSKKHNNNVINFSVTNRSYMSIGVEFKEKGSSPYTRVVYLNEEESVSLLSLLIKNKDIEDAIRFTPSDNDILSIVISDKFTKDQTTELWEIYKSEVAELPILDVISSSGYNYYRSLYSMQIFTVNISSDISNYFIHYKISSNTPKTATAYANIINKIAMESGSNLYDVFTNFNAILDKDPDRKNLGASYINGSINLINCQNNYGIVESVRTFYNNSGDAGKTYTTEDRLMNGGLSYNEFIELLKFLPDVPAEFDATKPFAEISFYINAPAEYLEYSDSKLTSYEGTKTIMGYQHYSCLVNLTDENATNIYTFVEGLSSSDTK